jgi:hypothetical protein
MQIQGGGIAKDELVHWMTVLEREINRLAVLLDDFRSLARPLKIDLQTVNLLELLEEMWLFDEPVCMAAGLRFYATTIRYHSLKPIPINETGHSKYYKKCR